MEFSRRTGLFAAAAAAIALSLSACGSAAPEAASTSPAAAESAFPVTVEHIYGTTEIAKKPERIATVSWVNADAVLALGVVPVGMASRCLGQQREELHRLEGRQARGAGCPDRQREGSGAVLRRPTA